MPFTMKLDAKLTPGGLDPEIVMQEALRTVNEISTEARQAMVDESQFGGTNTLRTGWQAEPAEATGLEVSGRVVTTAVQALVIDEGTVRHPRPPRGALDVWVRRVLGISGKRAIRRAAFAIGKAIKRRGLPREASEKGKFTRKWGTLRGSIDARMDAMAERIAARANK